MAGQSALRRWKPFFETFAHVDAAIEAADPSLSRDRIGRVRGDIVVLHCDAAGDDAKAEELCLVLDGVMAESLVTLRSVPADAVPRILASSPDLANAVAALRGHESERVRGLARDVVRRWRAAVEDGIVGATADMEKLDALSKLLPPENRIKNVSSNHGVKKNQESKPCTKISESLPKKTPPFLGRSAGDDSVMRCSPEEKMKTTKRKLREGYREVEDAKRQRKIQVIEAPKMMEQRQRKMHPIIRERSRARCRSSTAPRRSMIPSFKRVQGSVEV